MMEFISKIRVPRIGDLRRFQQAGITLRIAGTLALAVPFFVIWGRRSRAEYAGKLAERARIALELHDVVAQKLVSLHLLLDLAEGSAAADAVASRHNIHQAAEVSREILAELRRLLAELRPSALELEGLPAALEQFTRELRDDVVIRPKVSVTGRPRPLPPEVEQDLLRIAQEAITNALRYAKARHVEVELCYSARRVDLRVLDDGIGLNDADAHYLGRLRHGVRGMRQRAARLNAQFLIGRRIGQGTEIAVQVES